jgi:hypothetical protein
MLSTHCYHAIMLSLQSCRVNNDNVIMIKCYHFFPENFTHWNIGVAEFCTFDVILEIILEVR